MNRRHFLKGSLAGATAISIAPATENVFAAEASKAREYYELRAYHQKPEANTDLLFNYLNKAAIPALNRLGAKPVGVFTEMEPKENPAVWMLIPYPTLAAFQGAAAKLNADEEHNKTGSEYLQVAKSNPQFTRIDSWLLRAFSGLPRLEQPAYSKEKKDRIFELRTYESYSEAKAQKKVDMFNAGEIDVMREVGLGPIFYGQALIGPNLPHLTYMLSGEDREAHKKHWGGFGGNAVWKKLSGDPQYADTVSKITSRFLKPTQFSQI